MSNPDASTTAAKRELFDMLCAHLPKRFPDLFESRDSAIYNKVTDDEVPMGEGEQDPLVRLGKKVNSSVLC